MTTKKPASLLEAGKELNGYNEILHDVHSILEKAKYPAYKAIDNLRVQTYWHIGERIARGELEYRDKPDYGEKLLKRLAKDLNIAWRNIYNALLFYKMYPILQTVSAKLSWSHYVELITLSDGKEREFYETKLVQNACSVRELRSQIKSNAYKKEEVHYAIGGISNKIFVAEYKTKLPGEREIEKKLNAMKL